MFKLKPSFLLGIDVTANSVRLVELSYWRKKIKLESFAQVRFADKEITDELIINALQAAIKQAKPRAKQGAIALAYSAIIMKKITLKEPLAESDLEDFLRFNIEKYIGQKVDDVSFDYQIFGNDVHLITVRRERVDRCVKLLTSINIKPKVVDIDSYALTRLVRFTNKNIPEPMAICNFDSRAILMMVIDQNQILYAHEEFIDDGQKQEQILVQLKNSWQLCIAAIHQPIKSILLSGDVALMAGISGMAESVLGVSVSKINPFEKIAISARMSAEKLQLTAPALAISGGLALRIIDE